MSGYVSDASKVRRFDRSIGNDLKIVFNDSNHVCVMKLCPFTDTQQTDDAVDYDDYRRFHIRFYIPKFVYNTKNKKLKKFIIMFNGLNELDHFTLYDQIGQVLCRKGIGCALIPMPDHLNRHPRWRLKNPDKSHKTRTPVDDIKDKPEAIHERFLQYMGEVDQLRDTIFNCYKNEGDLTYCFYRNIFDRNVRVSCLGYSLGGLAALSTYLAHPDKYNACFLLNSGIHLKDIKLPESIIKEDEWEKIVADASDHFVEIPGNNYSRLFGMMYLGSKPASATRIIKKNLRKILFVFGGSDTVIPQTSFKSLIPDGVGLPIFQIPGLSHFPAIDREWNNWSLFTVNLISEFEDNASYEYWSKEEMIDSIVEMEKKYSFITGPYEYSHEKIENSDLKVFQSIFHSYSTFFPNFQALLLEAIIKEFKDHEHEYERTNKYCKKMNLSYEQTMKVLKHQLVLTRKGEFKKSGDIIREKFPDKVIFDYDQLPAN